MNKNPAKSDQPTDGPMSMVELKARMSMITSKVLTTFANINDFGAALRTKVAAEVDGNLATGDLRHYFPVMFLDITNTADKIIRLRQEVATRGLKEPNFIRYTSYLMKIDGEMSTADQKEKFRWVSQNLAHSSGFVEVFMSGMCQKLNNLASSITALEAEVKKLESKGHGAFSASETYYGPMSPSYMLGQLLAAHGDTAPLFSAMEMTLSAIDAAEAGRQFMGVTYVADNTPAASVAERVPFGSLTARHGSPRLSTP